VWPARTQTNPIPFPCADIKRERFNQPIFGANNIAGRIVSEAFGGAEIKAIWLYLSAHFSTVTQL
jgi:hypothetical protein